MHLYGPTAILGIISLAAILFIQFEPGFTTHQLVPPFTTSALGHFLMALMSLKHR